MEKTYIAIDLKSFYASVECLERNLDPLTTNLVVADNSRTDKTICLAVSPSLKSFSIPGRPRLFEVKQQVNRANNLRGRYLKGKSYNIDELNKNKQLSIDFLIAPPQMALYIKYSAKIYNVYIKYFHPDDIHVYSIDEVFIDATNYLKSYNLSAKELVTDIINDVLKTVGITATAGIGTNLYLCKIAMDIEAKKMKADEKGVRIAYLDEKLYREKLWSHKPLTDFWRIGKGYSQKLEKYRLFTMYDIALCSINNEDLLYRLFGVNAELLIDHAWGYEPCTMKDVKSYRSQHHCISSGQVLHSPYSCEHTKIVVKEMCENLVYDLVEKTLLTDQITLTIGYDIDNIDKNFTKEIKIDMYGRKIPKHSHGTINIEQPTSSTKILVDHVCQLFDRIIDSSLLVRRLGLTFNRIIYQDEYTKKDKCIQLDLFTDYDNKKIDDEKENIRLTKEKNIQNAVLGIKNKYGKNSIMKVMNLQAGATQKDRNNQIGGHKA